MSSAVAEEEVSVYNKASIAQWPDTVFRQEGEISTLDLQPLYKQARLPVVHFGDYELFLSYESTATIIQQIQEVIDTEALINYALICRRVLAAWVISRLGNRIQSRFD